MKKPIIAAVVVTIAIAVAGCSSNSKATSLSPTSASNGVTGFGATSDVWNTNHVVDKSGILIPGCCYDPDPKLKNTVGNSTDRYVNVSVTSGIVDAYTMNLPEGTSLSAAKAIALAEMPKDAKTSFFYVQDTCATMEITSATLKPILSAPKIGVLDGSVDFLFDTIAPSTGSISYDAANIDSISVSVGSGLASVKSTGC